MRLTFLGAAGTVTGSRFLLATDSTRVLVDCGLFQGLEIHRRRNREPLPFNPRTLDAIVLTHAHLDDSGFLPVVVNEGFAKPIYCSPPTRDLCRILLVGFQAPGTRGAALLEGERELKVHGRYVNVRAEVVRLDVFSAHADQGDLLAWIGACEKPPRGVFLVHGEPDAADAFRKRCEGSLGLNVHVPQLGDSVSIEEGLP